MDKLDTKLHKIFYYDTDYKIYRRHEPELQNKTMHQEFLWVINTQFGSFIPSDWDVWDTSDNYSDDTFCFCICSHPVNNLYYITHKPSQMTFQVGSECVLKVDDEELKTKMKNIIKRRKAIEKGNTCIYCNEPLTDIRKLYQKDRLCNRLCFVKNNYVIPFGKYKGEILIEFMCTKKGMEYIDWIRQVRDKDPNSFSRYHVFLEILDETVFE